MKPSNSRLQNIRRLVFGDPIDWQGNRPWAGRLINALSFTAVVFCLGLWITGFLLLRDDLAAGNTSSAWLNNLSCIIFFGGLVIAFFIGSLVGNILRRFFWRLLR